MPSRYQTPRQPELVIEIPACLEFPFLCLLLKEWYHLVRRKATPQASAGEDDWQSSSQAAPVLNKAFEASNGTEKKRYVHRAVSRQLSTKGQLSRIRRLPATETPTDVAVGPLERQLRSTCCCHDLQPLQTTGSPWRRGGRGFWASGRGASDTDPPMTTPPRPHRASRETVIHTPGPRRPRRRAPAREGQHPI